LSSLGWDKVRGRDKVLDKVREDKGLDKVAKGRGEGNQALPLICCFAVLT
jgi:hypothetical protein